MIPSLRTILRALASEIDNAARRACYVAGAYLLAWAVRVPARRETDTRAPTCAYCSRPRSGMLSVCAEHDKESTLPPPRCAEDGCNAYADYGRAVCREHGAMRDVGIPLNSRGSA